MTSVWLGDAALAHLRDVAEWPELGDRYELLRRVGRGGMGVVFAARDRVLERDVAVKVLDDLHLGADAAALFAEARVLGQLEHPGIVPVHDAGTLSDGRVFYVMKLVRGHPLGAAVEGRPLLERLDLFLRVCDAVAFAHAQGIVHCDLKPANIMLGEFGEVLVMDWGVATRRGAPRDGRAGTPGYMAPEQAQPALLVDERADIHALGVMLEGLLSAGAPRSLRAIAARARASEPSDRYATVLELSRDVTRFRSGDSVHAYSETLVEKAARIYKRHKLPIVLVVAYMVVRALILVLFGT